MLPEVDTFTAKRAVRRSRMIGLVRASFSFLFAFVLSQAFLKSWLPDFLYCDIRCRHDGWPFFVMISRVIFAVGIFLSMVAQARVEAFFAETHLLQFTRPQHRIYNFLDRYVSWSVIFLALAVLAIVYIDHPIMHILFSFLYVIVLNLIDIVYIKYTVDDDVNQQFFLAYPSGILKRFAKDLLYRVDYVSIVAFVCLVPLALVLYITGSRWLDESVPNKQIAEFFLSGFIGFQFIFTTVMIELMIKEWNDALTISAQTYSESGTIITNNPEAFREFCIHMCPLVILHPFNKGTNIQDT